MMRHGSDLWLGAALSGLLVTMLLLGAVLVRSEVPVERGERLIAVPKHSEPSTHTSESVAGLRGSLP
jgi:hypothetical protein